MKTIYTTYTCAHITETHTYIYVYIYIKLINFTDLHSLKANVNDKPGKVGTFFTQKVTFCHANK